jgi:hypothetical protein
MMRLCELSLVLETLSFPVYVDVKVRTGNPTQVEDYILNLDIMGEAAFLPCQGPS